MTQIIKDCSRHFLFVCEEDKKKVKHKKLRLMKMLPIFNHKNCGNPQSKSNDFSKLAGYYYRFDAELHRLNEPKQLLNITKKKEQAK